MKVNIGGYKRHFITFEINIDNRSTDISFIIGTWAFSRIDWGIQASDYRKSLDSVLEKGFDLGVRRIDTAPIYGLHQVEKDLGDSQWSKKYAVSSKFGLTWSEPYSHQNISIDFTEDSIVRECEESMRRLNRDQIDHYFLHYAPFGGSQELPLDTIALAIETLKASGKIRYFGVSNTPYEDIALLSERVGVDSIQFECNALKQWALHKLSPALTDASVEKWIYSPLARGVLSGKYLPDCTFDVLDHRSRLKWFARPQLNKIQNILHSLQSLTEKYHCSFSQLFINWARLQPFNPHVILGVKNESQLMHNAYRVQIDQSDLDAISLAFTER